MFLAQEPGERVLLRAQFTKKSLSLLSVSSSGLVEYLVFDFCRAWHIPPLQGIVFVGVWELLCIVGECSIRAATAVVCLACKVYRGEGAMETEQKMYVCVLEIGGKHLQILEIMASIILNIQRLHYLFLMISFSSQSVLHISHY